MNNVDACIVVKTAPSQSKTNNNTEKLTEITDTYMLLFRQLYLHAKEVRSGGQHSLSDHTPQHSFPMSVYLHMHWYMHFSLLNIMHIQHTIVEHKCTDQHAHSMLSVE